MNQNHKLNNIWQQWLFMKADLIGTETEENKLIPLKKTKEVKTKEMSIKS